MNEQQQNNRVQLDENDEIDDEDLPSKAAIVHENIRHEGIQELNRNMAALFLSAVAAGLSIGMCLLVKSEFHLALFEKPYSILLESLGYTFGFVIVIMARQQLFTENTLTAVLPILNNPCLQNVKALCRLWVIVLVGNLVGTFLIATFFSQSSVFTTPLQNTFFLITSELINKSVSDLFIGGIISGWIIATMVWMFPTAGEAKLWIIILMTYILSLCGFPHIIIGSVEAFYLIISGNQDWTYFFYPFAIPTLAGNILGGTFLFTLLSHLQIRYDMK